MPKLSWVEGGKWRNRKKVEGRGMMEEKGGNEEWEGEALIRASCKSEIANRSNRYTKKMVLFLTSQCVYKNLHNVCEHIIKLSINFSNTVVKKTKKKPRPTKKALSIPSQLYFSSQIGPSSNFLRVDVH